VVKSFFYQRIGSSLSEKLNIGEQGSKVHSQGLDAIAYSPLATLKPMYKQILGDLYASNQTERDL
jgi:hypothetical protein